MKFEDRPILKCGCVAMALGIPVGSKEKVPSCITHSCFEIAEKQPNLKGRMARCAYYSELNKYYKACCNEKPSSTSLWFFEYKPKEKYDQYYCACRGDD